MLSFKCTHATVAGPIIAAGGLASTASSITAHVDFVSCPRSIPLLTACGSGLRRSYVKYYRAAASRDAARTPRENLKQKKMCARIKTTKKIKKNKKRRLTSRRVRYFRIRESYHFWL